MAVSDDGTAALDAVEVKDAVHAVHLYKVAVSLSQQVETSSVEPAGPGRSPETDLDSSGGNISLPSNQTANDPTRGENAEVVLMTDGQEELMDSITAAIWSQGGTLVTTDPIFWDKVPEVTYMAEDFPEVHGSDPVIAYFETIPNVYPSETSTQFTSSPETVLSSALSSEPISSTVPITSKHSPPSPAPMVVALQRPDADGDDGLSEAEDSEQLDHQLEEHW